MKRILTLILATASLLAAASPAQAEFGLTEFDVTFTGPEGESVSQAGAHPFAMNTSLHFNSFPTGKGGENVDEQAKDLIVSQIPGFVGNPVAVPRCSTADFITKVFVRESGHSTYPVPSCSVTAAVGTIAVTIAAQEVVGTYYAPVYNLEPPPGRAAKLGFWITSVPVTIELGLNESPPYNVVGGPTNISQILRFLGSKLTLWGDPASPAHDSLRGNCIDLPTGESVDPNTGDMPGDCPAGTPEVAFLTVPRACRGPLATTWMADAWADPGAKLFNGWPDLSDPNWLIGSVETHDESGNPLGFIGCGSLNFNPSIGAVPTSKAASSPTGLDFSLDVQNEGLLNPEGFSNSDISKAVVTLPEGMSANPSLAEGLEVCTMADLDRESAFSETGEGCPNGSKIGTVEVETPLLDEAVKGSLFIAKPYENYADNSLLALYVVLQNRELGISVKQALKVEPDPVTGQLTTVAEGLPELPFSHFKLHFREGARSPLTTPQACGVYNAEALLYPSSGAPPLVRKSAFQIITGPNEGPCPSGGLPPFKPGLNAGTINNRAGSFSPFYLRLHRSDSEQEITHFSIKLPPGVSGKLAGIPYCPDAAIEAAKARTGPHGGQEELDSPSCPAASQIGRTLAGAGVGPSLTYAPGKVYLAGPYNGSPLSMVAITAGVVGPFDIGTVVIREAFQINPETAEVFIDSTGSDPIPHIIRGIPVHLRDIRAYVDRPEFVLNPTDCSPTSTASTVLGSGLDFVSEADDNPVTVASRFQAADCAALSFKPLLSFRLIGGTKRGAHPKLVSHLQMNGIGEAGIDHASVLLPHSEFIENAHFNNICTRVQFKEGAGNGASCPAGSIYGRARAVTPILSEPLEGPVMLRSNPERQLPDVVAALHNNQVDFDLVGNVDSVKGQLRTTFAAAPDAPVTSFDLELAGGSKGLFVNSTNLCLRKNRARVHFAGQNGKEFASKPVLAVKCKHKPRKHKRHRRHARSVKR